MWHHRTIGYIQKFSFFGHTHILYFFPFSTGLRTLTFWEVVSWRGIRCRGYATHVIIAFSTLSLLYFPIVADFSTSSRKKLAIVEICKYECASVSAQKGCSQCFYHFYRLWEHSKECIVCHYLLVLFPSAGKSTFFSYGLFLRQRFGNDFLHVPNRA